MTNRRPEPIRIVAALIFERIMHYVAERVFRLGFWRDYVFIYLIFSVVSLCLVFLALYLPFMPLPPKDADVRTGFALIIFTFVSLPMLAGCWLIFWLFLFAAGQRVVFADDSAVHHRFRMFLPFHTEVRIPLKDVDSVLLSPHMRKKMFPETGTCGFGGLEDGSGYVISYTAGGRAMRESMPMIREKEYYEEVRRLVRAAEAGQ